MYFPNSGQVDRQQEVLVLSVDIDDVDESISTAVVATIQYLHLAYRAS